MRHCTTAGLISLVLFLLSTAECMGQEAATALFRESEPLTIRLNLSFKEIKKKTNDSTYLPAILYYQNGTQWDSVEMKVRSRGFFRKQNCFFTPLHLKFKKEFAKGTLFEGNKDLKLVLPCETSRENNSLVMKEYLCYQMYEHITPYVFSTRLVNIELTEGTGNKTKKFQIMGILIEDDDLVAKRHHASVVKTQKLHPIALHDTTAIRYYIFQYMIANTDWSTTFSHNSKTIKIEPRKFIPLAYDFDMAGFVDAPYAIVNEGLGIPSVRTRLYRGFCYENESVLQYVRKQYIELQPELKKEIAEYEKYFEPKEFLSINQYLDEFFVTMKNDTKFRENIVERCRAK